MTNYIYGLHEGHERDGYRVGEENNRTIWIVTTHAIGRNPEDVSSFDYTPWSSRGHRMIARLNHGYNPNGTIPEVDHYAAFAARVRNWVQHSAGCHRWIIGNEMNHETERPYKVPILPDAYALCFSMCHELIHATDGHEDDEVIVGAVAPYNNQTQYAANPSGDWIVYLEDILSALTFVPDGVALHTYTHGADPSLVRSDQRMDPPFDDRHFHFFALFDFLKVLRGLDLEVYVTETNQGDNPWVDVNSGWVKEAYKVVDEWNRQKTTPLVRCLALYRWPQHDQWSIVDKPGVIADLEDAMKLGYKTEGEEPMAQWKTVHFDGLDAFYDPDPAEPEVTIPVKHHLLWDAEYGPRPEMDKKDATIGQPEVFSPPYSAVGFHRSTKFRWWVYTDQIAIQEGARTRFSAQVMVVAHGTTEDPNVPGSCGMRIGIGGPNETDPSSPNIIWSDWWVVRGSLENERVWHKLTTGEVIPAVGACRLFIQCNNDEATTIAAGHWDDETVEQYLEDGTTPPPQPPPSGGDEHTISVYLDDQLICEHKFVSGTNSETVNLVKNARNNLNAAISLEGW